MGSEKFKAGRAPGAIFQLNYVDGIHRVLYQERDRFTTFTMPVKVLFYLYNPI